MQTSLVTPTVIKLPVWTGMARNLGLGTLKEFFFKLSLVNSKSIF